MLASNLRLMPDEICFCLPQLLAIDGLALLPGGRAVPTERGLGIGGNSTAAQVSSGHINLGAKVPANSRSMQQRNRSSKILGHAPSFKVHAAQLGQGARHAL